MSAPSPTWSVSRAILWHRCPRWYLLRHRLHAEPATGRSTRLARGTHAHLLLTAAFSSARAGHPPEDDRVDMGGYLAHALASVHPDPHVSPIEMGEAVALVEPVLRMLPIPRPDAILAVENSFHIEHGGVSLNGSIDYAIRTGSRSVHVRDWKSGDVPTRPSALLDNPQLGTYAAAEFRTLTSAETITVGLFSLSQQRETVVEMPAATAERALHRVVDSAHAETRAAANLSPGTVDQVYPPRPGEHCGRCPFRPYCPARAHAPTPIRDDIDIDVERARVADTLAAWPTPL